MIQWFKQGFIPLFFSQYYEAVGHVYFRESSARSDAERFGRREYTIWRWFGLLDWRSVTVRLKRGEK